MKAFADKTDFDYHLQDDPKGIRIYPTISDLRRDCPCVAECGIVEVEIKLKRVVQERMKISEIVNKRKDANAPKVSEATKKKLKKADQQKQRKRLFGK